jgi:hypothetical protein
MLLWAGNLRAADEATIGCQRGRFDVDARDVEGDRLIPAFQLTRR